MSAYAELVAASNFSFLRGASRPEELAVVAGALGYKALAICDRNSVAGVVRAHKPAKELRLKYIPGCRLVLQDSVAPAPEPTRLSSGKVRAAPRVGPGS
jgi:error-prone DNA polymerase